MNTQFDQSIVHLQDRKRVKSFSGSTRGIRTSYKRDSRHCLLRIYIHGLDELLRCSEDPLTGETMDGL